MNISFFLILLYSSFPSAFCRLLSFLFTLSFSIFSSPFSLSHIYPFYSSHFLLIPLLSLMELSVYLRGEEKLFCLPISFLSFPLPLFFFLARLSFFFVSPFLSFSFSFFFDGDINKTISMFLTFFYSRV